MLYTVQETTDIVSSKLPKCVIVDVAKKGFTVTCEQLNSWKFCKELARITRYCECTNIDVVTPTDESSIKMYISKHVYDNNTLYFWVPNNEDGTQYILWTDNAITLPTNLPPFMHKFILAYAAELL